MNEFTNGYDDGFIKGHTEGYEDGYVAAANEYEPRMQKMWVELQTLNARIDHMNTLIDRMATDGNY